MDKLKQAIDAYPGGCAGLAAKVGVSRQFLHQVAHGAKRVPARLVLPIEKATRRAVTRYEMRPDVFGDQPRRKA